MQSSFINQGQEEQPLQKKYSSEAYKNFINSVGSEESKFQYETTFAYFMKFCKIENYDYDQMLFQNDIKKIESIIRDYIIYLRVDRKLSPATISLYIASISAFYQMNDNLSINWKKLRKIKGKTENIIEDTPYTREQIKTLIDYAELREKCLILLMSSAGLRRGALPILRIKDMISIDKYNIYKIKVYKKDYITFCTHEARRYIDQYLDWRKRQGERLTPDSPLFRKKFDSNSPMEVANVKTLSARGIGNLINDLLNETGVRPNRKLVEGEKKSTRTELMQTHGFRKFFKTTSLNGGMNPVYSEFMMGHKDDKLLQSYFKPTDDELLTGNDKNIGYIGVMQELTINPTAEENDRLKRALSDRRMISSDEFKKMEEAIAALKKQIDERDERSVRILNASNTEKAVFDELVCSDPNEIRKAATAANLRKEGM